MKKGILFDMDGTLWDSARQVAESWNLAAAESGYPDCHLTTEDIRSVMGKTMDKIAAQLFPFTKGQEREALLEALIQQEGRLILTVDAATGGCRAHGPAAEHLPEDATCRSLSVWYLRQLPPTPERAALRRALTLKQVLARLETAPAVELELPAPGGRPLQLRCSRLEGMSDVLLVLLNGL